MMRFIRDLRFIPIALIATACLLALKTADLVLEGGYLTAPDHAPASDAETGITWVKPGAPPPTGAARSWAQQMFNFPGGAAAPPPRGGSKPLASLPSLAPLASERPDADITGTIAGEEKGEGAAAPKDGKESKDGKEAKDAKAKEAKDKDGKDGKDGKGKDNAKNDGKNDGKGESSAGAKEVAPPPNGTLIQSNGVPLPSGSERAILERLQERRQELDARARELDIREGLIAAAEKRVEGKITELKQAQLGTDEQKKDEAEIARFKGLVTMYENMKPRDAAKIFDHLEMSVLLPVASQINPRRMSDILAQMSAESAERLTVELASRAQGPGHGGHPELPKIEGRPTTP